MNTKFGEERAYPRYRPQSYKLSDYKFSAENEKYYMFTP